MFRVLRDVLLRWDDRRANRAAITDARAKGTNWESQPKLTREDVTGRPFAVAIFTARWDGGWVHYRPIVAETAKRFHETAAIGFVDTDADLDFALELGVKSVPVIGFFRDGDPVAFRHGWHLDLTQMAMRLVEGREIVPIPVRARR